MSSDWTIFLAGISILSSEGFRHLRRSAQPRNSVGTDDEVSILSGLNRSFLKIHRRPGSRPSKPYSDGRSIPDADRLIKQTYSVHVSLPADRPKGLIRKWHLSKFRGVSVTALLIIFVPAAYFSPSKLQELDTIDNIRGVGDVAVPEGWFRSARIGRNRRDSRPPGFSPPSPSEIPIQPAPSPGIDYHRPSSSSMHPYPSHHIPSGSPYSSPYHPSSSHPYPPHMTSPNLSGYPNPALATPSPRSYSHDSIHSSKGQLVPLEVLVRTNAPRRDPEDEILLRRFQWSSDRGRHLHIF